MGAKSLKHQCLPWENRVGCHSEETRRIKPALTCVFFFYQLVPLQAKHCLFWLTL